jgi:C-terminal processing protease CtpA/Prc
MNNILPLIRLEGKWWIDAKELTPDVPLWGPYDTKAEAQEDRAPFVKKIREKRNDPGAD